MPREREGRKGSLGKECPGQDGESREAPEGEPPERENEAASRRMGAATGGADPLDGGVPREAGAATESCRAEEPVPGPSGLGQMRGLATQREAPRSPAPDGERDVCMEPEPQGPLTREPNGGHCWPKHC